MIQALLMALTLAGPSAPDDHGGPAVLSVPYLSQTEALCGGAAAAMVFRYWGDRYADIQQFEPLVDRTAGGIRQDVFVEAIRARAWRAVSLRGSIDLLRADLVARRPVILLIEDRPDRYHYVVAVGADDRDVYIHDPTWGPARRYTHAALERVWQPTDFWALRVLPRDDPTPTAATVSASEAVGPVSPCDRLIAGALAEWRAGAPAAVEALLSSARLECPSDSRPVSELAGVRFAERRWQDAAGLAEDAVHLEPSDAYAWDVLASSRFVLDDRAGALQAWNHVGKPRVDRVDVDGLRSTSYALVAEVVGLRSPELLTDARLRRAERRLRDLPIAASARVGYRPDRNGFAVVDAAIVERRRTPGTAIEWAAKAARSIVHREVDATLPGGTGKGEVWTASWRWWSHRPRVSGRFLAPQLGALSGVWRVEASWEAQSYALSSNLATRQERLRGAVAVSDWLTPDLRYDVSVGVDAWDGERAVTLGASLDRRLLGDRLAIGAAVETWSGYERFASSALRARFRSATERRRWLWTAAATVERATSAAPLGVWPGAGEGHARPPLLRAHPLLREGIVAGPVFGRQLAQASVEVTRWVGPRWATSDGPLAPGAMLPFGFAVFADAAHAGLRMRDAVGQPFHVDAGVGFRLGLPGREGTLRVDVARGLRDAAHTLTFGLTRDW